MNWKPIVAGVDGTPESVRAAVVATMVAQRAGTSCTMVSAVPDYEKVLAGFHDGGDLRGKVREVLDRDRAVLAASLKGYVPERMIDGLHIRPGRPPVVLREAAQRLGAGAIVVGHRRHQGLERLQASLVSHLLRSCDVPVLVASSGSPVIQRVLVGLDLSYASEAVFDAARQWARLFGAQLRALHVIEPMPVLPHATIEMSERYYRADEQLRETGLWSRIGEREAERVVRSGYPASVLAGEAAEWRADLLIIGTHGRGWAERLLVGSTAEDLFHQPPAMTLVIPVGLPAVERSLDVGRLPWEEPAPAVPAHA